MSLTLVSFSSKDSPQLGLYSGNSKATGYVQTNQHSLQQRNEREKIPEDVYPLRRFLNPSLPLALEWALQSSICYVHESQLPSFGEFPLKRDR